MIQLAYKQVRQFKSVIPDGTYMSVIESSLFHIVKLHFAKTDLFSITPFYK